MVPRKKPAAAAPTNGQPAPTASKQRKRKAKVDPPSLPASASAPFVTEPAAGGIALRNAVWLPPPERDESMLLPHQPNVQLSSGNTVTASAIFNSWSLFVPVLAYDLAADNASAGSPYAAR
ncbi:hypothetical protein FPQ18DRAFT_308689 [Pyronema domesticum]|nr:hypothetical protein FPQ18DRAFT_308689 [Pyronema domesticum]